MYEMTEPRDFQVAGTVSSKNWIENARDTRGEDIVVQTSRGRMRESEDENSESRTSIQNPLINEKTKDKMSYTSLANGIIKEARTSRAPSGDTPEGNFTNSHRQERKHLKARHYSDEDDFVNGTNVDKIDPLARLTDASDTYTTVSKIDFDKQSLRSRCSSAFSSINNDRSDGIFQSFTSKKKRDLVQRPSDAFSYGDYISSKSNDGEQTRVAGASFESDFSDGDFVNESERQGEAKINEEKRKLEVMVKIFGRKTPLELSYTQVEKI